MQTYEENDRSERNGDQMATYGLTALVEYIVVRVSGVLRPRGFVVATKIVTGRFLDGNFWYETVR